MKIINRYHSYHHIKSFLGKSRAGKNTKKRTKWKTLGVTFTTNVTGRYIRDIWSYLINMDLGTYSTSVFS
jgi:hypothetical protein